MRIEAYIRVVSDEDSIRAIHKEADVPDATMKPLKAKRGNGGISYWWNWETARIAINIDSADEELQALLSKYRPVFPLIKKQRGRECDVYLEVVTEYTRSEEPRGLYLSSGTIALLNELGGALDNDVIVR